MTLTPKQRQWLETALSQAQIYLDGNLCDPYSKEWAEKNREAVLHFINLVHEVLDRQDGKAASEILGKYFDLKLQRAIIALKDYNPYMDLQRPGHRTGCFGDGCDC